MLVPLAGDFELLNLSTGLNLANFGKDRELEYRLRQSMIGLSCAVLRRWVAFLGVSVRLGQVFIGS
jgi:hypothetical protein